MIHFGCYLSLSPFRTTLGQREKKWLSQDFCVIRTLLLLQGEAVQMCYEQIDVSVLAPLWPFLSMCSLSQAIFPATYFPLLLHPSYWHLTLNKVSLQGLSSRTCTVSRFRIWLSKTCFCLVFALILWLFCSVLCIWNGFSKIFFDKL